MAYPICDEFMQQTSLPAPDSSPQEKGEPQPPLEEAYDSSGRFFTLLPVREMTKMPLDVRDAMEHRRTVRKYQDSPLSIGELSVLLWYTQGVKEVSTRPATLRIVPSAGARHAFETLLLINRVTGLEPGLYRYIALEHKLLNLTVDPQFADRVSKACLNQAQIVHSCVTFFWVAIVERMTWRYQGRGYRYLFLDAGHICQNLFLTAESIGSGVCPIGAFNDAELNQLFGLDGKMRFVVYGGAVGKKVT